MLLLQNSVFIPTLQLLQSMDSLEGQIPSRCNAGCDEGMKSVISAHSDWLLQAAGNPQLAGVENSIHKLHMLAVKDQAWRIELAKRRCVWCWNRSTEQLNFMWKIYGDRGIVVFSTVGRIRQALEAAEAQGIASRVRYIPVNDSIPREDWNVLKTNVLRPHLFKDSTYRPEREVRFVLKADPRQMDGLRGALIKVDARLIIYKMYVSPHMPMSEAMTINLLTNEKRFPSNTLFPPGTQPSLSSLFAVEPDLPTDLFPDLD